jgi:hypothetical protein
MNSASFAWRWGDFHQFFHFHRQTACLGTATKGEKTPMRELLLNILKRILGKPERMSNLGEPCAFPRHSAFPPRRPYG